MRILQSSVFYSKPSPFFPAQYWCITHYFLVARCFITSRWKTEGLAEDKVTDFSFLFLLPPLLFDIVCDCMTLLGLIDRRRGGVCVEVQEWGPV